MLVQIEICVANILKKDTLKNIFQNRPIPCLQTLSATGIVPTNKRFCLYTVNTTLMNETTANEYFSLSMSTITFHGTALRKYD